MKRHVVGMAIAAMCLLVSPARSDFAAGVAAYDRGDYAVAFEAWQPLAQDGDPAAQRNLGHLYRFGSGVAQDFTKAAYWYREAAETDLAGAQANLAMMYLRGQGLDENPKQAAYWFERAAKHGHTISQYNLALIYLRGQGVKRDEARAMAWFHLAAKAGHQQSLEALSKLVMNSTTLIGPSPPPPGWKPSETKSKAESVPAKISSVAGQTSSSEDIARGTSTASIRPAKRSTESKISKNYRPTLADHRRLSEALVAFHVGDFDLARAQLLPLARAGMAEAQYQLGRLHGGNSAVPADRAKAYAWFALAAERGYLQAQDAKLVLFQEMTVAERNRSHALLRAWRDPS